MNEFSKIPKTRAVTQAAEGMPRWAWTLSEFDRLIELGILGEDDKVELIGGELVPRAAKGNRHELVKTAITNWIVRRLPEEIWASVELGWRSGNDLYLEPDIVIFPQCADPSAVTGAEALLVIEIAAASLARDQGLKCGLYAALGVRDYWVINAETLAVRVHREPDGDGFKSIEDRDGSATLQPLLMSSIKLNLSQLVAG